MLADWNHRVFKDDSKYRPVGKIAAAVAVYLRYARGEETRCEVNNSRQTIPDLRKTG